MVCSICLEYGHNIKSCYKYQLPFFFINNIKKNLPYKCNIMIEINKEDIELFYTTSTRNTSDEFNKKRELLLCQLGNGNISNEWLSTNEKWDHLHTQLLSTINILKPNSTHHKLIVKGGRSKNYDFELIYYNNNELIKLYKLEFKYGVYEINECPQFVSPMKPSQYFDRSYEELFYDKYLPKLCEQAILPIPDKETYLTQIHTNKPECMLDLQEKYYKGAKSSSRYTGLEEDIEFYKYTKQLNNQSILEFLETSEFNVEKMNTYLLNSQKDKLYLLWNNGSFNLREKNLHDYQISPNSLHIKNNNCLEGKTLSGCKIKLLLRWKNGVAYPGLQIS